MPTPTSPDAPHGGMPPASIELLFQMYAMQAFVSMGRAPNPVNNKTSVDLAAAKHAIDMLDVIEAKTKGNLSPAEAKMLGGILHQARLAFVEAKAGRGGK